MDTARPSMSILVEAVRARLDGVFTAFVDLSGPEMAFVVLSLTWALWSVLGNTCIIMVLVSDQKLRKSFYNQLVASLSVTDFCTGAFIYPLTLYQRYVSKPLSTIENCDSTSMFINYFLSVSTNHLVVISFERYFKVTNPMRYHSFLTPRARVAVLSFIWIVSSFSILSVKLMPRYYFVYCEYIVIQTEVLTPMMAFTFFMPLIFLVSFYVKLYRITSRYAAVVKQRYKFTNLSGRRTKMDTTELQLQVNDRLRVHLTTLKKSPSAKDLIEAASKQQEVLKIVGLVVGAFVAFIFVDVAVYITRVYCPWPGMEGSWTERIFPYMAYANSGVNPIIYFWMKKDYRRALANLFTRRRRRGR